MLVLVLRVLANGAPYPHWPVKTSECTVERQGSWPMCAIRQRQSGWERCRLSQLTIMSHSGEMNPWKRHIILITKGLASLFYDTCDWRTIMYCLIPSSSQQPALTFAVIMESPDQNRNMSGSSRSPAHTRCPYYVTSRTAVWQISTCIDQYVENNSRVYVNTLEQDNSRGNSFSFDVLRLSAFYYFFWFLWPQIIWDISCQSNKAIIECLALFKGGVKWSGWQQWWKEDSKQ